LLSEAFRDALNRVPLIISSGGLGPTEDDLTRETVPICLTQTKNERRNSGGDQVAFSVRSTRDAGVRISGKQWCRERQEPLNNPRDCARALDRRRRTHHRACAGPPRELEPMFRRGSAARVARRASGVRMFIASCV